MIQKPSAGRIVHYVIPNDIRFNPGIAGQHRPAIVIITAEEKGWGYPPEAQVVQLQVFMDGRNDLRNSDAPHILWATSVSRDELNKAENTWHEPEQV